MRKDDNPERRLVSQSPQIRSFVDHPRTYARERLKMNARRSSDVAVSGRISAGFSADRVRTFVGGKRGIDLLRFCGRVMTVVIF